MNHQIFKDDYLTQRPELFIRKHWLARCRVNILIVTDGSGSFDSSSSFGLGLATSALSNHPWSHIEFNITKAHRQTSAEAGVIDNFRFDQHNLANYSQIWLFGVLNDFWVSQLPEGERKEAPLSPAELRRLSTFMEQGGGVFATGDHEDLGKTMCSEIPRVRSMRRWHWPNPGPNGEPVAPDSSGPTQHDTVMNLNVGGNQSDSTPQPISPVIYRRSAGSRFSRSITMFPHPVLCGPNGMITYLPDHMHEGTCEVPSNLDNSFTFDGLTVAEYPSNSSGVRPHPQVIAYANSRNNNGNDFGVIGAYDGHPIDKGRVIVDATWHHWFNINLYGLVAAADPASPSYDATVVPKWQAIQAYYRNIAVWLARPSMQSCIRNGGWMWILGSYDIQMFVRDIKDVSDTLGYYSQLGRFAKDALGRFASQCQTTTWIFELLVPFEMPFKVNPWEFVDIKKQREYEVPHWLDMEEFENFSLGAALHGTLQKLGVNESIEYYQKILESDDGAHIENLMRENLAAGFDEFAQRYKEGLESVYNVRERMSVKR